MPLSFAQLLEIRDECLADDIDISFATMKDWDHARVTSFFENGGKEASPSPALKTFDALKIFGDSHANSFISFDSSPPILAYPYTAGSAMGLRHADSITGYRLALEGDLAETKPSDAVILKFGQVDCDFVYYLKWIDNPSLTFDAFATDSVSKYFSFVDDLLGSGNVAREQLFIVRPSHTSLPPIGISPTSAY